MSHSYKCFVCNKEVLKQDIIFVDWKEGEGHVSGGANICRQCFYDFINKEKGGNNEIKR